MKEEIDDFVNALYIFVANELQRVQDVTYCRDAIRIVDARNHLFRNVGAVTADESADIYLLAGLCCLTDDMRTIPDRRRMECVARNYWRL
ncbi:MAG: hypothetical protein NC388_07040 [Clostridium sp.]|nr:hypothetical protein [Clostridium sp.]